MSLIGRYFHTLHPDTGKIHWQGFVVGKPEPGIYLVQLFEWMIGEPNLMRLVRIEDMLEWLFYGDKETMVFSYEYGVAREGGPYRERLEERPTIATLTNDPE